MYCENCGKELNTNARFCQYCGAHLEKENIEQSKEKDLLSLYQIKQLIHKREKNFIIYIIWFALNLICLVCSEGSFRYCGRKHFVPFNVDIDQYMDYYDFSEFIVYAIAIPVIYLCIMYLWKHKK